MASRKKGPRAAPETAPDTAEAFPAWKSCAVAGVLLIAGLIAYASSFGGVFLFDDIPHFVENDLLHHVERPAGWLLDPQNVTRPVVTFSLAMNYALSGVRPWSYHAFNLLAHVLAACALFGILRRTFLSSPLRPRFGSASAQLAFWIALMWLVHPLQTQAVTYVIQRCESLMGLFFLLTLYGSIRAFDGPRKGLWTVVAALSAVLGAGCKQVIVVVPLLVLLYDSVFVAGSVRGALKRRGLYAALSASWLVLIVLLLQVPKTDGSGQDLPTHTMWEYARSQPGVLLHYLRLALWPDALCFDYWWPVAQSAGEIVPGAVVIGGLLAASAWSLLRAPAWGFVGAWFFLILAPTSSVMPIADLAVEHRMYLPLAAMIVAVVCGAYLLGRAWLEKNAASASRARNARVVAMLCAAALSGGMMLRTYARNGDYCSARRIWEGAAELRPQNPRAQTYLGLLCMDEGNAEEGTKHFQEALRLRPTDVDAHYALGRALMELNKLDDAEAHFLEALKTRKSYPQGHNALGLVLSRKGNPAAAIAEYEKALKIWPDYTDAIVNLGTAFLEQKDLTQAAEHYKRALAIRPDHIDARYNLTIVLFNEGKLEDMIGQCQQVLKLRPDHVQARNNLASALFQLNRLNEAISVYEDAVRLNPTYVEARMNLAIALAKAGRENDAAAQLREALRVRPDYAAARQYLQTLSKK